MTSLVVPGIPVVWLSQPVVLDGMCPWDGLPAARVPPLAVTALVASFERRPPLLFDRKEHELALLHDASERAVTQAAKGSLICRKCAQDGCTPRASHLVTDH